MPLGGLSPVTGSGVDPVLEAMAFDGMRIHAELGAELPAETGLDTEYGHKPLLTLAFDDAEVRAGMAAVERQQQYEGYSVRWLEQREARAIEPRISDEALGGVHVEGSARVDPYRFSLALAAAAERLGASIRKGEVTGLEQQNGRVTGVCVGGETLPCEQVVIASGPWSVDASEWLGFRLHVGPLKGPDTPAQGARPAARMHGWLERELRHEQAGRAPVGRDDRGGGRVRTRRRPRRHAT